MKILEEIGLEKAEIQVYLALLELGTITTGPLIEKSKVPSSRIYTVLQQLIEKGLVSHTTSKNTKYFQAASPEQLKEVIQIQKNKLTKKEKALSPIIKELKQKFTQTQTQQKEQKTQTFEGIKGIKTALENVLNILNKGDTFIVFGAPRIGNERLHAYFNDFHKRRAKKGINYKVLYDYDAKEFGEERKKYKLTKVKYLKKGMNTPSVFWLFKDYVALIVFSEEPIALVIKNKQISESFIAYFDYMWQNL